MEEPRLKIELELHVVGDGRTFINFWDWRHGDDVTAELKDNKLYQTNENHEVFETSLTDFIFQVKARFKTIL